MKTIFASLITTLLIASISFAAPVQVFGPKQYAAKLAGATYSTSFTHSLNNAQGVLTIINGDGSDLSPKTCTGNLIQKILCAAENVLRAAAVVLLRPTSIEVSVNGVVKATSNQLAPAKPSYQTSLVVNKTNTISIKVKGSPLAYISVGVKAESAAVNLPPVANFTFNPNNATAPVIVSFSGLTSTDDQGITAYEWQFGDGGVATGAVVNHLYNTPGNYSVKLTVKDAQGASHTKTQTVTVIADTVAPLLTITRPVPNSTIQNAPVQVLGSANERLQFVTAQLNGEPVYSMALSSDAMSFSGNINTAISGPRTVTIKAKDIAGNLTTKVIAFNYHHSLPPIARLTLKTPATGTAPYMVLFDGSASSDPQGQTLTYFWDFGDGEVSTESGLATHLYKNAGSYTAQLIVKNQSGLTSTQSVQITVNTLTLPVDPATVAPPLTNEDNVILPFDESIAFLYKGPNPTQKNVTPGTIKPDLVSVVRGQIVDTNDQPLSGVKITVNKGANLGYTLTREDGFFDIAINGGGDATVQYEKAGYLPAQRTVKVDHLEFATAEKTILVATDPKVTKITNNAAEPQLITASTITDEDGTRTAKISIPSGTSALIELPNGTTTQLSSLSMRVTEYTVGENGPQRMPASLPTSTSYTYAADVTADEALALGAKHIRFSKPVSYYVDNFLNFPTGMIVPVGSYDYDKALWIGEQNGKVIRVLNIQNGLAALDLTGSGAAATPAQLAAESIDEEELRTIASSYTAGASLWRVRLSRFSPIDLNLLMNSSGFPPALTAATDDKNPPEGCPECKGSIINPLARNLQEIIPIVGTNLNLLYSSQRYGPDSKNLDIILSQNNVHSDVRQIELKVEVAGVVQKFSYSPNPFQRLNYTWSGLDAYSRPVPGRQKAKVTIGYKYAGNYFAPAVAGLPAFGAYPTRVLNTNVTGRDLDTIEMGYQAMIGDAPAKQSFAGDWTLPIYHHMNPSNGEIFFGNGRIFGNITSLFAKDRKPIEILAGDGSIGQSPDGTIAKEAKLEFPFTIQFGKDKSIYFSDSRPKLRRIRPDNGQIETIAGNGTYGYSGDGGPATEAQISAGQQGIQVVEGEDKEIFLFDWSINVIRKIDKNGIITRYAGNGTSGYGGDNGPAINASFSASAMRYHQGSIFIGDINNHRIREITSSGYIHTIAGTGTAGVSPDETEAVSGNLFYPSDIALTGSGEIVFTEPYAHLIRKIDKLGKIKTIAGIAGNGQVSPDGTVALGSSIKNPNGILVLPDNSILFNEDGQTIRQITPEGVLITLAGNPTGTAFADNKLATQVNLAASLRQFDVSPSGEIYMALADKHMIAKVKNIGVQPPAEDDLVAVASEDGSEIYYYNSSGLHVRTNYAQLDTPKYYFIHNSKNELIAIKDSYGNETVFERNSQGQVQRIISPYGQTTNLTFNSGKLSNVQQPNGNSYQLSYGANGLLSSFRKPNGALSSFRYDLTGKLIQDENGSGGFLSIESQYQNSRDQGSKTSTAEGVQTLFDRRTSYAGRDMTTTREPSGEIITNEAGGGFFISDTLSGSRFFTWRSEDQRLLSPAVKPNQTTFGNSGVIRSERYETWYPYLRSRSDYQKVDETFVNEVLRKVVRFDSATKTFTETSGEGRVQLGTINNHKQTTRIQIGNLTPTVFDYDSKGRISSINTGSRTTEMDYGSNGLVSQIRDPIGRISSYQYDDNLRVIKTTNPDGYETNYQYDANNNLVGITPAGRPNHQLNFNLLDLIGSYTAPTLAGQNFTTTYSYDLDKRIKKIQRPDGNEINFSYFPGRDQVSRVSTMDEFYDYAYDKGRLTRISTPQSVLNINYLGKIPVSESTSGIVASSYSISLNNLLKPGTIFIGSVPISITYDKDELPIQIGAETLSYNENATLEQTKIGNTTQSFSYNSFNELTNQTTSLGSTIIQNQVFNRDDLGRIISKIDGANTTSYNYDLSGRLSDVIKNGVSVGHYEYDQNGNRTQATVRGNTSQASYDNQDRLVTYGSKSFTYNLAGDLTSITNSSTGATHQFTYDVFSNLKQAVMPGKNIQYITDGKNRRIAKRINGAFIQGFVYGSQTQIVGEFNSSNVVLKRFYYGSKSHSPDYMNQSGVIYRIIHDQLGSIRQVINATTGIVAQEMTYDEFGMVLSDTNPGFQPFGFAGGLYDRDTGLVRFGARDYDPEIGRWTTKDPIGFGGGDSNLYNYAGGDPVNSIDPSGLKLWYGDKASEKKLKSAVEEIMKSAAGRRLLKKLHDSSETYYLNAKCGSNDAEAIGNEVNIDPNFHPEITTDTGTRDASTARVLAHELGHLAGASDDGTGNMNNVNKYENPIMAPIEGYRRVEY